MLILNNNEEFKTDIINVGDGISISKKISSLLLISSFKGS